MINRLLPAVLRIVALGLRSLFIFFLARYLLPEDVGLYGLLMVTISFAIYPLGLDFYTYSTRQIIQSDKSEWRTYLRSQTVLGICMYFVVFPFLLLIFFLGLLPWSLLPWFYLILITEFAALEIERILIAVSDQMAASFSLVTRQALLPIVAVPLFLYFPETRNIQYVFIGWFIMNVLGLTIGVLALTRHTRGYAVGRTDWSWIRMGIRASLPFLAGTLLLRAIFTVDRQVVGVYDSLSALGAYTVYVSVGAGIGSVLGPAVHQFAYPRLVKAAHEKDLDTYTLAIRALLWQSIAVIVAISAIALVAQPYFVNWVGGGMYAEFAWVLPWVLLVFGIYNLSLVPHFGLYSLHADKAIFWSTAAALFGFVGGVLVLIGTNPAAAVILGIGVASSILLIAKTTVYIKLMRRYRVEWKEANSTNSVHP